MHRTPLILALFLSISFSMVVYADSSDQYQLNSAGNEGTVILDKGWNLVTNYALVRVFQEDLHAELEAKHIRAIFLYDRYAKEYIRLYPEKEQEKLNRFIQKVDNEQGAAIREYAGHTNGALWVYADERQTVNFHTVDGPLFMRHVGLKSGWNFLMVTPEMINKSLDEVKGTCNIQAIHWWSPREQQFLTLQGDKFMQLTKILENAWSGFILKVSSDCQLGGSGEIAPPALPTLASIVSCTDNHTNSTSRGSIVIEGISSDGKGTRYEDGCVKVSDENNYVAFVNGIYYTSASRDCLTANCYAADGGNCQGSDCYQAKSYCDANAPKHTIMQCPQGCNKGVCL